MAIIKCKMCGGDLNITEGLTVAECEYCGSKQTIPTADNDKKMTLFTRASRLLRGCEFDKAAAVFENIVAEFPDEAEAYWGLLLCKYGIEYVDDPVTGKKVPTCHRSSFDSVLDDVNFELACENTDALARRQYRSEARQIEELRRAIIEVSGREEPYDLFISYKETDEQGERTLDSVIAQDIYDAFTQEAYRVFFSRISLEDKLGVEYEPYIFAALNSANVMLVVGTDYENFDSVWVKNEWSRFLKLMTQDKNKHLIPVYKNMDPYDMPKEFVKLAAQDMGKLGAMQDLVRGVKKMTAPKKASAEEKRETVVIQQSGGPNVQALLKRGNMALEDKNWNDAAGYFDRVLDMDAECAEAYLGLFLIENKSTSPKAFVALILKQNEECEVIVLEACPEDTERMQRIVEENFVLPYYQKKENIEKLFPFDRTYESSVEARNSQLVSVKAWLEQNKNLVRAFKFADGEALDMLNDMHNGIIFGLQNRVDKARAEDEANIERIKDDYAEHLDKVEAEAKRQREEAEAQCEADYLAACEYADRVNTEHLLLDAAQRLSAPKLRDYKDCAQRAAQCRKKAEQIKAERITAQEAERQRVLAEKEAERQRKAAEKEERRRLAAEEAERKRALARERRVEAAAKAKKIVIAVVALAVLAGAGIFLVPKAIEIAPSVIEKMEQGKAEKEDEASDELDVQEPAHIEFVFSDDGTLTISGNGEMGNYYDKPIPWGGYKFSAQNVIIQEGITSISKMAFWNFTSLKDISIPSSVTDIASTAFEGCSSLKSITIPDSVTSVGMHVFNNCTALQYVRLGKGLTTIGPSMFYGCSSLSDISLPENITNIGLYAFDNCKSLKSINIPSNVVSIGNYAFIDCESLSTVYYEGTEEQWAAIEIGIGNECLTNADIEFVGSDSGKGHETISWELSDDGTLTVSGTGALDAGKWDSDELKNSIKKVVVSPGITCIGWYTFSNYPYIQEVVLQDGLETIYKEAFSNCVSLRKITLPASLKVVDSDAFLNCPRSIGIEYMGTEEQWKEVYISKTGHTDGNISLRNANIEFAAIASGNAGENISWVLDNDGTLTISGTGAMEDYILDFQEEYTSTAPWNTKEIIDKTRKLVIQPGVTHIGDSAFYYCTNLREVVLPDTLISIGNGAFDMCTSLSSVNLPSSLKTIEGSAFAYCHSLSDIQLPEGLEAIDGAAFAYSALSSVELPSTLKFIGSSAFGSCHYLWQVKFNEGIETVGDKAFSDCRVLKRVELPSTLKSIGYSSFSHCDSLTEIALPEGVERIDNSSFASCSSLIRIELPSTLRSIGIGVFTGCNALRDVVYMGGSDEWAKISIGNYNQPLVDANIKFNG